MHNQDVSHLINEQLGNLYGFLNRRNRGDSPLRHNRYIDDLADELQMRRTAVFCTVTTSTFCCTQRACNNLVHELADRNDFLDELQLWEPSVFSTTGRRPPCQWTATAKSRWSADRRNHGDLPLRHDRDKTLSTHCSCVHLTLHNNGHVDNLQEQHLEHEGQHCGNLSLRHNWNVHHLDDELDLRHLQVFVRHGLLELKHDHKDVHKPAFPPRTSALTHPHHPGTHFGAPGRRPRRM